MVGLELNWAKRQAAYLIGYGAGYAGRSIRQQGDDIEIGVNATPAVFTQRCCIGAGRQLTEGPEGSAMVTPSWGDGGHVLIILQTESDGSMPVVIRQYFSGQDMMVEMTAPNGATGVWRFQRQ